MKDKETVSEIQMAFLLLSFMLGSAIVNIPSPLVSSAGNAAWLSLLIALGIGMLLLACILFLNRHYAELTFIDYFRKTFGNWSGVYVGISFSLIIFIMLTYIVIDAGLFLNNTLMRNTPMYIFHAFIFLVAALTAYAGIEVMGRMFTMLIVFITGTFLIFLLLIIPLLQPEQLLPLFPDGMKPVFHGVYINYGFPYAEVIFFAVLLPFARKKNRRTLEKAMFFAIGFQGFLLLMAILVAIMVLGPVGGDIKYSLFFISTLIDIQDILTRIEAIPVMAWIIGSYMKAAIALFALNFTISQILNLKDDRILIFPIALLAFLASVTTFEHELQFAEAVSVIYPLVVTITAVLPILFITVFTLFKKKQKKQNDFDT